MGIGPTQLARLEQILSPGMKVLTVGRLVFRPRYQFHHRDKQSECYFDEYAARHYSDITVESIDASAYQGARILQDMNLPLSDENQQYRDRYDLIIDGGSLEHFFNVPQALTNYHELLATDGIVYVMTNANNHFGHGFYQFSSELFYRVFSEENGYEIMDCFLEQHPFIAAEISARRRCYDAPDPESIGRRTQFISNSPVLIHAIARKGRGSSLPPSVIQSDYRLGWEKEGRTRVDSSVKRLAVSVFDVLPVLWRLYDIVFMRLAPRLSRNRDFPRRRDR